METRQDLEPSLPDHIRTFTEDTTAKLEKLGTPYKGQRVDTSMAVFSLARRLSDRAIRERCLEASTVARSVEWAAEMAVRSGHEFTPDELKQQLQELHQAATFLGRK